MNGRRAVALALALLFAPATSFVPAFRSRTAGPAVRPAPLHVAELSSASGEGLSDAEKRVQELMEMEVSARSSRAMGGAEGRAGALVLGLRRVEGGAWRLGDRP